MDYALAVPQDARRRLALGWLWLGLAALIGAGVFSLLLVASRTPLVQNVFPLLDFFHVALVVHVDLSVLVWFLAFAGAFWSLNCTPGWLRLGWGALAIAAAGAALMTVSPFVGQPVPVMSNYVPVLESRLFLAGLMVFAAGVALLTLRSLGAVPRIGARLDGAGVLRFGLNAAAVSTAVAIAAFAWSWAELPAALDGKAYYELLFWGGGHVLQFTWTLLMFVAWLWLASESGCSAAADAAGGAVAAAGGARIGVPHPGDLSCVRRDVRRASPAAHLADAVRRRADHPAHWRCGGDRVCARRTRAG